jgi:hypothetical protein
VYANRLTLDRTEGKTTDGNELWKYRVLQRLGIRAKRPCDNFRYEPVNRDG